MRSRKPCPPPAELERVHRQFERWRSKKSPRARIPERLWRAAARLCRFTSVHTISRALRLNHTDLKRRVEEARGAPSPAEAAPPAFIELGVPQPASECVVELEDGEGARLKVTLRGCAELDLTALTEAFWSRGS